MAKLNCWEYMICGREPGGAKADELGVCIVCKEQRTNGLNCGNNGGRVCWAVTGTLCGGGVQGAFALKLGSCIKCEFHKLVIREEGDNFVQIEDVLLKLKK